MRLPDQDDAVSDQKKDCSSNGLAF